MAKALAFPVIFLISIIVLFAVWNVIGLPTNQELVGVARHYFEIYGYPVLLISAIIESIPIIYIYFPGSSVILLAAAMSRQGTMNLWGVVFTVAAGIIITYIANYWIGYYGLHKAFIRFGLKDSVESTRTSLEKHGDKWLWLTYGHPNFGALTSLTCGITKYSFKRFLVYSFIATVLWCGFWGVVCYFSSGAIIKIVTLRWLFFLLIVALIIWKVIVEVRKFKKSSSSN